MGEQKFVKHARDIARSGAEPLFRRGAGSLRVRKVKQGGVIADLELADFSMRVVLEDGDEAESFVKTTRRVFDA